MTGGKRPMGGQDSKFCPEKITGSQEFWTKIFREKSTEREGNYLGECTVRKK